MDFTLCIHPFEGMGTVSIHESEPLGSSSIREENRNLMEGFWRMLPEVKNHIWICKICGWVSLLRVNKVWELNCIIYKEHWSIVSNHVKVSFFSVKLDCESSWISSTIIRSFFTCYSRKPLKHRCFFANLVQKSGLCELSYIISNFKKSVSSRTFCMNDSFWDSFSVKMSKLIN